MSLPGLKKSSKVKAARSITEVWSTSTSSAAINVNELQYDHRLRDQIVIPSERTGIGTYRTGIGTSTDCHNSNNISHLISSPTTTLQQFIPLSSDDHYITGTSDDGKLRLRMDKATLQQLTDLEVNDLYLDPVAFLMTTEFPLLQVYKRIETTQNSGTDVHYHNTQATGYCQPAMLEQLYRRHQSGNNTTPDKLDLHHHTDRERLILFINILIQSLSTNSPETLRYRDVITQLHNGMPYLDSALWMGLENIHEYQFSVVNKQTKQTKQTKISSHRLGTKPAGH